MAFKEEVLVETDFLFGLRKGDKLYENVMRALTMNERGEIKINILSTAVLEVRVVLYSKGLKTDEIEEVVSMMDVKLIEHGVNRYTPITLADVLIAERIRREFPELGFFDSLHAAVGRRLKKPILSSELIYRKAGLKVIDLTKL